MDFTATEEILGSLRNEKNNFHIVLLVIAQSNYFNMRKLHAIQFAIALALLTILGGCGEDEPVTGYIYGTVTGNGNALEGARIIVFNANTNAPANKSDVTDVDGSYRIELPENTYALKVYANGFNPIPGSGVSIPVNVKNGKEILFDMEMDPSEVIDGGVITGRVVSGEETLSGVLVIASSGASSSSFVTDPDGHYYLYNLPVATYNISGFKQDFNSSVISAVASSGSTVEADDIAMSEGASGSISGSVTLLATENAEVDVALVHPVSEETIPGLSVITSGQQYEISGVPDGDFYLRATYANDGKAMDPDWLIKNPGALDISFSGNSLSLDFSVTGAVALVDPTNPADDPTPVLVENLTPEFTWNSYSSASDYVIEVYDSKGKVIWGGFNDDYTSKNIVISGTSITYNSDGMASQDLESGKTYRWKIYASKDDNKEPTGWKLISSSEEQMGIFKVQ